MQKVPIKIWPNLQNPLALYLAFSTKLQEALCGFLSPAKFHATKATLAKTFSFLITKTREATKTLS